MDLGPVTLHVGRGPDARAEGADHYKKYVN